MIYTSVDPEEAKEGKEALPARIAAYDRDNEKLWEIAADATGDLILVGNRLYAAGKSSITAVELPQDGQPARIAWSLPVNGEVVRLLAASDRLFAVTLDGRIMAFAEGEAEPKMLTNGLVALKPGPKAMAKAKEILDATGQREGYALWFGIDDSELLEAVALQSDLRIVAVDRDAEKVIRLRPQLGQGWNLRQSHRAPRGNDRELRSPALHRQSGLCESALHVRTQQ